MVAHAVSPVWEAALPNGGHTDPVALNQAAGEARATALEMVKGANLNVPFIFLSGNVTTEMRKKALRLGAADCLSKDHRGQFVFRMQQIWNGLVKD